MPINLLLKCNDINETKAYYRDTLGFSVDDTDEGTCTAQLNDCTLIFTNATNKGATPNFSGTIYCFIDKVDEYYEKIKNTANVYWPLQDMAYGTREFGIQDNNNYTLAFAENRAL